MKLPSTLVLGGGVALAAVLGFWWLARAKGGTDKAAASLGRAAGGAAVAAADGVLGGVVNGIGGLVGVPATDSDACGRALAEGRTWDASFACPAWRFVKGSLTGSEAVAQDVLDANDARARRSPATAVVEPMPAYRQLDLNDSSTWGGP